MNEDPNTAYDHLEHLSAMYGLLAYFAYQHDADALKGEFLAAARDLARLLPEFALKGKDISGYRRLHSYVKLYAAWIYKFFPKRPLVDELIQYLRENAPPNVEYPAFYGSEMELLGYPTGRTGRVDTTWFPFPSEHWGVKIQRDVKECLNDMENYREFNTLIQSSNSNLIEE
jgi:hypothetical protein